MRPPGKPSPSVGSAQDPAGRLERRADAAGRRARAGRRDRGAPASARASGRGRGRSRSSYLHGRDLVQAFCKHRVFRGDATVFRVNAPGDPTISLGTCITAERSGTMRSREGAHNPEVAGSNPAPLLTRPLVTGPSCSQVGGVAAERSSARPWNVATPLNCAGVAENGWLPSRITSGRRAREMLRNGRELPGSGAPGHVCGRRFACRSDGRPHCIARHISLGFGPRSAASP
jgi:hypothetical protein